MEFILLITMALFIGFCAIILGAAVMETYGKGEGENPLGGDNHADSQ